MYVLSVNDSFVMNSWFSELGVQNVKPIADGNGDFTRQMGMLMKKEAVCFGYRSQRYSMVVDNGLIEMIFCEVGKEDNYADDPFSVSDATSMLNYLTNIKEPRRDAIKDALERQAQEEAEAQPAITESRMAFFEDLIDDILRGDTTFENVPEENRKIIASRSLVSFLNLNPGCWLIYVWTEKYQPRQITHRR